jgi:hypothetical protein
VDRADVGVVQGGSSLGLPLEAAEGLGVVGEAVGKELQGDVAAELQVFRFVHQAHAPAADPAEDAIVGNRLPYGLGGRGHWLNMLGGGEGQVNARRILHSLNGGYPTIRFQLVVAPSCYPSRYLLRQHLRQDVAQSTHEASTRHGRLGLSTSFNLPSISRSTISLYYTP